MVQVTNTSSGTSQQPPIKLEQPKANVDNKSSMPQETNYANLFDQFNVKPKIRMYMQYPSTESEGDVKDTIAMSRFRLDPSHFVSFSSCM